MSKEKQFEIKKIKVNKIARSIRNSIQTKEKVIKDKKLLKQIKKTAELCIATLQTGGRILIAGNGGSAADAQHFAAELVCRFYKNREALAAIALTTDTSILTAGANDFGFETIFSRQIEALGRPGDIFIGISTSGNSPNIVHAFEKARTKGIYTLGLSGKSKGKIFPHCDMQIRVPSEDTPRIQEVHILVIHILCNIIEDAFAN